MLTYFGYTLNVNFKHKDNNLKVFLYFYHDKVSQMLYPYLFSCYNNQT